ncbi:MAG: 1-acyl-sn-glycerol-3-phosphate acyltransferase [Rhodothermia bacterium]|nr:1-acyl-sn-glycerol-3-phosphate acyltransferase [Rhodothermia bacterium]
MNLVQRLVLSTRRFARLISFAAILLAETLYLVVTVGRRPPAHREAYRATRQSVACARAVRSVGIKTVLAGETPGDFGSLIVSNHLGMIDPFIVGSHFKVVFSGKAEMLEWPVAGWVCRAIGLIPVYRGQRSKVTSFADQVAEKLQVGLNVLAFPEGTTSGGTDILPFKTGAFAAVENLNGGTVLPITLRVVEIDGNRPDAEKHAMFTWSDTSQSLLKHFWRLLGVGSARVEVVVGPPIRTTGHSRKQLADIAYRIIKETSTEQFLVEGASKGEIQPDTATQHNHP